MAGPNEGRRILAARADGACVLGLREAARAAFEAYAARYDATDERIALKVEHTYEVAALCDSIARDEGLGARDVDLAWLCGLLHDIGRFEQLRRWNTFSDAASCSHAILGLDVLQTEMPRFTQDGEWTAIISKAVAYHSDFRLPPDLSDRERLFCAITRDADKVDILRVFGESSCTAVLGIQPGEFADGEISDAAFSGFREHRCLSRDERLASLDGLLGTVCLVFELEHASARRAVRDLGYLDGLLDAPFCLRPEFTRELTRQRWSEVRATMAAWEDGLA